MMKIVYNSKIAKIIIPNFKAILLFKWLLCKKGPESYNEEFIRHESCHEFQWKECSYLGLFFWILIGGLFNFWWCLLLTPLTFYIWYCVEYLVRLIGKLFSKFPTMKKGIREWWKGISDLAHKAYKEIVFEQEAYTVEKGYLECSFLSFFLYY